MALHMARALLLVVVLCICYSIAHGGDQHSFVVVPTSSLEPESICSTSTGTAKPERNHTTVTMPLVHRHGPCAPSRSTDKPSFTEALRRNLARMNHIKSMMKITQDAEKLSIPTHLGSSVDSLEYVVTVGIGTPAVPRVVLIDTGSDLSWVQCKPCNSGECSPQKNPLFDPSNSSTYSPIPCGSDPCKKLAGDDYGSGCTDGDKHCRFAIVYADGSSTKGVYSTDTLTLAPGVELKDFHFGCGRDKRLIGKYDGLLGLGRLPESLEQQYGGGGDGGAFSYCLPAVSSNPGFLALGVSGENNPSAFVFTPMGSSVPGQPTFYTVTLTGIAVGGRKLDLPQSAFDGGMVVDSGTVVTALQSTAFRELRSAFREAMAAYPLVPNGHNDTCYNFTGHKAVAVPRVALTFSGGATVDLDVPKGVLVDGCLAFAESGMDGGVGFLGNVNQRTFEVLFDNSRSRIGFRANAC
ncbi:hypothetical protein ACP70R_047277 [Stipagrostis hirtigluma subsp. patula]